MENGKTTTESPTGTSSVPQAIQNYGQTAGTKISEAATHAKDFVNEKVAVVGDKIKELQNVDVKELADNAKDYARKNPGQAILISAAAGLVLGLILRSGRR
jgi:ElaB/YqjD/DUF883 family membrane-anchored ribosome-binding protein